MIRKKSGSGNRAISALFRVFGGAESRPVADRHELSDDLPMHERERMFLSISAPLTVAVMIWDLLHSYWNTMGALLLTLPLALLTLHLLPFILPVKTPKWQWRVWLGFFVIWACFQLQASTPAKWFAGFWLGIFSLNLTATLLLILRATMNWSGMPGIVWRISLVAGLHLAAILLGMQYGWHWALLIGAAIAAALCLAMLRPRCQWLGEVICESDDFLITIDDGPDPETTPALLDLLDKYQTKAVFFMIGEKVSRYPGLARQVLERGHDIGNHTLTHPHASFWCAGPWRTLREISGGQKAIHEATGHLPQWFRAPVGHRNLFTHPIAAMLGMRVMAWNRRGFDAVEKDPGKVLGRILPCLRHGDIVLLHESTPIAAEVLEPVLKAISSSRSDDC